MKINLQRKMLSLLPFHCLKGTINSKNFGYKSSTGVISFATEEAANLYAKNRAVSALNFDEPIERAILLNKNQIINESDGNASSVIIEKGNIPFNSKIIHGHTGTATPISLRDFMSLNENVELNSVHAYNKYGEFSSLYKNRPISKDIYANINKKLLSTYINNLNRCANIKYIKEVLGKTILFIAEGIVFFKKIFPSLKDAADNTFNNLLKRKNLSKSGRLKIHKFWEKNANIFGVTYTTNFSEFL